MNTAPAIGVNQLVRVRGRDELGSGEVVRVRDAVGGIEADVAFEDSSGRRLLTFAVARLELVQDLWHRLKLGPYDSPIDFLLKQLAIQLPLHNSGGELSNSRTDLLPHQILLTHEIVAADRRRFLVADDVGLGKTIETGMVIRELISRGLALRVLIVCPAGLVKNWQRELQDCFRLRFEILRMDFQDSGAMAWEHHHRVIASIDTLKQPARMERLLAGPKWDLIIFDEAHHLSRTRYGKRVQPTQNFRLAESVRGHTRDLLFLSATPHQGDAFQFWSLIQLLDDQLFDSPESMLDHRGLLSRVMIRRMKREVTYADGTPVFMRRQVITERFQLAARERAFYERLSDYLREGYGVAGVGENKTTSQQRAVGFVMTTFQKIMSSSPRAIRQALRRRLLVLLLREQIGLELKRAAGDGSESIPAKIVALQEEMRGLAVQILELASGPAQWTEADAYIAGMKRQLSRKLAAEESTAWSLDGDEDADEVMLAETNIPNEGELVRELIRIVPQGTDRKFDTLVRAVEQLRSENGDERFIVFTQYRETLEFVREELGKLYGADKIVAVKGGPLDDKIAAVEQFWDPQGARILISTSAGSEGINLQVCRILFNYDLPWNPMAIEQRIGRIHRYGQQDTVQVYNLLAEDTVEQRIYDLLDEKLADIARTIGKVDPVTGTVVEDFRGDILGLLGSSPNYQDLYRKALIDRDYRRTAEELTHMIETATRARDALESLSQDMTAYNLEHYRRLQGELVLADLKTFVERAIIRLGGTIMPDGDLYRIQTPAPLLSFPSVSTRYDYACFRRDIAMRRKKADLMGIGHPLVDAIIMHCSRPTFSGEVARIPLKDPHAAASVRYVVEAHLQDGSKHKVYESAFVHPDGTWRMGSVREDFDLLEGIPRSPESTNDGDDSPNLKSRVDGAILDAIARVRSAHHDVESVHGRVVGVILGTQRQQGELRDRARGH